MSEINTEIRTSKIEHPTSSAEPRHPTLATRHFRLAASVGHPHDGTSFYRAIGPLAAMAKESRAQSPESKVENGERPLLEYALPPAGIGGDWELTWNWLAPCDGVFMRPVLPIHAKACRLIKQMGLPLWVDWDDDQTCLPECNPHKRERADEATMRKMYGEIVAMADFVSVSTAYLAERIGGNGLAQNKIRVIPNARMHALPAMGWRERQRVVSWRGSAGHDEDVMSVAGALNGLSRLPQFSKWTWVFLGDAPWIARRSVAAERAIFDEGTALQFLVELWNDYGPHVNMVPLANNTFNRCKSNIAWIEGSCAGAITIAPDWEEWRKPGVRLYRPGDHADFESVLRGVMSDYQGGGPGEMVQGARAYIAEHLRLEKVNGLRWSIIEEMT